MLASWARDELKDVDLNDKRLNRRLEEVLSQLGGHPTASLPAACGGYAETAAAYRLFDNEKVGFDNVLAPHVEKTRRRIAEQPLVILAQDTTEVDLTRPEQQVAGAGPLDDSARRGVFLHPLIGFTPDGTPLGTVHAKVWARDDLPPLPKSERSKKRKHTSIEEKESMRWLDAFRQARKEARLARQTRFVCVADSEADIYELLAESQAEPHEIDWIVRACQNRALQTSVEKPAESDEIAGTATNYVRGQVLAGEGIQMSRPLGFNNTYAIGMKKEVATRMDIRSISDLVRHPELKFGFSSEFMDRGDGWPRLREHYRLPQKQVRGLDHDLVPDGSSGGTGRRGSVL